MQGYQGQVGIDPQASRDASTEFTPYNRESFEQLGVLEVWQKYSDVLTWGKGQTLAVLDDGCDITTPQWQAQLPWGPKVIATGNTVEGGTDPAHRPPGYHGTTVGYPSSVNYEGLRGIAYNNQVAHVRCVTTVHLPGDESATIAEALQWVIDNHQKYNITTVNLAPVDDIAHPAPIETAIDEKLRQLRERHIWVSAPCANNNFTDGISWPACAQDCFAIGAVKPGLHEAYLDRFSNTDLLAVAQATSSSNAYAVGSSMILREAIEKLGFDWQRYGVTIPDAMLAIFQQTGIPVHDPATDCDFRELNLLAAIDFVFGSKLTESAQ